ncbi:MAG TPA: CoA transferase [Acidimicrobiales bacterium]|nr:CoA transferase [Acidimicrobiales bacterium]
MITADGQSPAGGTTPSGSRQALAGVRVLDLSTGVAGPMAAMLLADFGADVVKVEPPSGDPTRSRPGSAVWNRNKRSVVVDVDTAEGRTALRSLLAGADVCVRSDRAVAPAVSVDPVSACGDNPGLVFLDLPSFLDEPRWSGGAESSGLLAALSGMSLRQSSFDGGPVDPVFPYVLYLQAAWAAAAALAALIERQTSGHGQVVTVGGVHAGMVASSASLVIDRSVAAVPADYGPGGPHPMYTRYRCADGGWIFLATLTAKFQERALAALGLADLLEDERLAGKVEAMPLPANRTWVRRRFEDVFESRPSEEWLEILRSADVPAGPLLERGDWLDSPLVAAIGMRVEIEDPVRGVVVMPANPVNLVATPATVERPAPRLGEHTGSVTGWAPRPAPTGDATGGAAPLAGIRVLDLGTILAGPYAGTLLAELGADVIKVEVPAGDSWRDRGMPYIRGQRGVAIDLRTTGGRRAFHALVRSADVVLDNYRAGVLGRLAIDYERLREVNPDILSVSITGFGEDSPFASYPAFDPLLQARSGMMKVQGGDSEPVLMTVAINDVTTAALAVLGTLIALFHRGRTGEGQQVWLALAGTSALAQSEELVRFEGRPAPPVGGRDFKGPSATDRSYATGDGWIRLQLAEGARERLADAGFTPGPDPTSDDELAGRLAAFFAAMSRDEAVQRLTAAGLPAVPVRRLTELPDDPEYQRLEVFNVLPRANLDPVVAPGRYARFSRTQHHQVLTPPGVGEHTAEVLAEVGFAPDEIQQLADEGAVRLGSPMVHRSFAAYR